MKKYIDKIIELRKSKSLMQKQIADKLGMTQVSYSKIETGKTELTLDRLFKIADILEVSVIELIYPDFNEDNFAKELQEDNQSLKKQIEELKIRLNEKDSLIQSISSQYKYTKNVIIAENIIKYQSQILNIKKRLENNSNEVEREELLKEIEIIIKSETRRFKQLVISGVLDQSDLDASYNITLQNYLGDIEDRKRLSE